MKLFRLFLLPCVLLGIIVGLLLPQEAARDNFPLFVSSLQNREVLRGLYGGMSIQSDTAVAYVGTNDCKGWAAARPQTAKNEPWKINVLGCRKPYSTWMADSYGEGCSAYARQLARNGYRDFFTIQRKVKEKLPHCTTYEDGSYEDSSTH